jgi:hypothetical protein
MTSPASPLYELPEGTLRGVNTLVTEVARLCKLADVPESYVLGAVAQAYSSAPDVTQCLVHDSADPLFASQALTHWHESAEFLESDGSPRPLSLERNEFEDLCAAVGDRSRAGSALGLLLTSGAVSQRGGMLSALRRNVIVGQSLRSGVDLAIRLCGEFAKTLNYNQTRSNHEPRRFERTALSTKFAARHVPALLAYMSLHAESFLEDLDNWLKARDSESDSITVGVGVHLFLSN